MEYPAEVTDPGRRHDFVLLFDVADGNPNGDPDAGNLPRVDPETMHGLVTDVCLKRKVRDWVAASHPDTPGLEIYVKHKGILNREHQRAYEALGIKSRGAKEKRDTIDKARAKMCELFYDVRTFGAVMTTQVNCGQVRGPIQLTFARSIDPIVPLDVSITRVAVTREEDAVRFVEGEEEARGKETEMGRKAIVPYGLYRSHGFFVPAFARDTGFTGDDLKVFWDALLHMWDLDHSASRGLMSCRGLYVFTHDNPLGSAPAHRLFDLIKVTRKAEVPVARSFADYVVTVEEHRLPQGVTLRNLLQED